MKKILHKTCLSGVMLALFAILTAMGTAQAKEVTVTQTTFSKVSAKLVNTATGATDPYISYESAKGNASTAPAINNNIIRIYQNGGLFTVKAASGAKIKSITLQSDQPTTVSYSVDNASAITKQSIAKRTDYTIGNLNASSVLYTCTGTDKNSRLYVCKLSVTYDDGTSQGGPATYNAPFADKPIDVINGGTKQLDLGTSHPALTFTPADSEIASVSADGLISAKKVGSQEFTATWSGSDDWVAGSAKFTVNVTEKSQLPTYTLVSDFENGLEDGQYIIACNTKGKVATSQAAKGRNAVDATFSEDLNTVEITDPYEFTITKSGSGYTIKDADGKYLYCTSSDNVIKTQTSASVWSLGTASSSTAVLLTNNTKVMRYNAVVNDENGPFRAYAESTTNVQPIQLYKIATPVDPDAVAKPTITFADNKVTITSAEGTTVRYTTDGTTTPTATVGTEYKDPFTITASCTVKAVAIKDGKTSEVATLEVTYVAPYANFAEMIAAGAKDGITVNGPITVVYANMKYLYTYDKDNKGMLLYGTPTTSDQVNGKAYASVTGNYVTTQYVEIADYTLGAKVEGSAIAPEVVTPGDVTKEMQYKYVKLEGVKYDGTNLTADGKSIAPYNKFYLSSYLTSGKYYDVVGIVDIYSNNLQVLVISFTEVASPEQVAMPVIAPDGGDVFVDTPITLSCATADAKIYYTTNSTPPTTASTLYDAATPITLGTAGSATVKAIAVKDGMEASEVATATFTVKDYAIPTGLKVLYHGEDANNTSLEVPVNNVYSFSCNDATKIVLKDALKETIIAELEGPNATYTFDNTDEVMVTVYGANNKYNSTEEKTFTVTVLKWLKEESYSTEATYSVLVPELTFNEDYVYINTYPGAVLYIKKDTKAASAPMRANAYTSEWTATDSPEKKIFNEEPGKYLVKAVSNHDKFKGMESEVVGFTIDEKGTVTGIEDVEAGAEECEVEYYNLQGVRVMNPTKGIYIRKYGSKVTKVCL